MDKLIMCTTILCCCMARDFSWCGNYHTVFFQKIQCQFTYKVMVMMPRLSRNTANDAIRGKGLSMCIGHTKWALYSTDYKPVLQLQTPCTFLPNVSLDLIRHAGWSKHKGKVYAACFLLWRIFKSWSTFSTYCESDFTIGLETRRRKNATNCDRHRTSARKLVWIHTM